MSSSDGERVAGAFLEKARGDEAALVALVGHTEVPDHVIGFLAQQAVEKSMKAVLIAAGVPFDRSHDLEYLHELVRGAPVEHTDALEAAAALSPWAVDLRYPEPFDSPALARDATVHTVRAVVQWATASLST